jgi:crotonobetainyl-CoA:carnitine CoA-transferase CaiB-like acyl-CoA transferase
MTRRPMEGVRVLEVAQYTFVPAAGGVLADWGASVVKVEHAEYGDAQRGLTNIGTTSMGAGSYRPIMEHPNRGKRSIGLALEKPEAMEVLHELVKTSDVFLTNFLPAARRKLHIEAEDIRKINPQIIYVRGSGYGVRGPDANRPGFDGTAFWSRGGSGYGVTPLGYEGSLFMPSGAYGDSMGGMSIAGGIAGALFARERTGESSIVDVSLLSVGAWATGLSVGVSLMTGDPMPQRGGETEGAPNNPIHGQFKTADGRYIQFSMLQPGRYWPEVCRALGRDDLIADQRFSSAELLIKNAPEAGAIIREEIRSRTLAELAVLLQDMDAPWAIVQNSLEVGQDPALRANGYIQSFEDADGVERELVANPVQFDETPPTLTRAPQFAEHTDDILRELGHDEKQILELKMLGAVT